MSEPRKSRLRNAAMTLPQAVLLLGLPMVAAVALELGGESLRLAFRYDRIAVMQGEYWRLLSGHLVHGSWEHLLGNLAGAALIGALFPRDYSLAQWLLILLVSVLTIDFGFVFYEPQLQWYVGLSGVLHGALAAGAVAWWRHESRILALILTAIFVGKLMWEQTQGALPASGDMPVIVNAHLYGALGGLVAVFTMWFRQHRWPGGARSL